jgi:predicted permease
MSPMIALYILFFLLTFLVIGIVHFIGKKRFKADSECRLALAAYIRTVVRITSLVGALSLFLIGYDLIPANGISFLCIPFFMIIMCLVSYYFRLARQCK